MKISITLIKRRNGEYPEPLSEQVDRLAEFILEEVSDHPVGCEGGAVDCAIRIIREFKVLEATAPR